MKKLNLLSYLLLVTVLMMGSCSEDAAPKEQFKANGETFTISKNAKIYLVSQNDYTNEHGNFVYRNYFISDGTLNEGQDGWDVDDYTDATYYLSFEPIVPAADGDFSAGSFPASADFFSLESGQAMYFYSEIDDTGDDYYETSDGESTGNFIVTGGMDDGETMSITFSGGLSHWHYVEEVWTETKFTGSIFFKAVVDDVRPL